MNISFNHSEFTALCVLLNSEGGICAEDYQKYCFMLANARTKLNWIAEQRRGCLSCKYFVMDKNRVRGCGKADGKTPPDNIQRSGCEAYEWKEEIPF